MVVRAEILPLEIRFDAPAAVRDALATMGRTEDVRLAPSGRRLAFACYANERIALADVEITASASGPEIAVSSLDQLASPELREPHGIDFVDDDTLIVGNRAGGVDVFLLPAAGATDGLTRISPAGGGAPSLLNAPSSVAVRSLGSVHEVLACNNWANTVTRHTLDGSWVLSAGEVVAHKWLDLPDGVAISHDGRWLAVSNHYSHQVLVYAYSTLNQDADPVGILRGVQYPHGVRFGAGDRHLLVADAGAPYVHLFVSSKSGWQGVGYPAVTIRVMDDDTFARGQHNPQEGGPKGIDVDPRTNVLVVTSECVPLAFFDLTAALDRGGSGGAEDALVRYELHVLAETARVKAAAAEARAQLTELRETKAWRLTLPARRAYSAVLRLRSRRS
jgi:hypothetical protein